jgi:hypothetical protein
VAGDLGVFENVNKIVSNMDRRWIPGLRGRQHIEHNTCLTQNENIKNETNTV